MKFNKKSAEEAQKEQHRKGIKRDFKENFSAISNEATQKVVKKKIKTSSS